MTFKEKLKEWNDGVERGAAAKLARQLNAQPSVVTPWLKGQIPSEQQRPRIAKVLGIGVDELLAMFAPKRPLEHVLAEAAPAYSNLSVRSVPVVGVVGAAEFMFNFDDPPLEILPVVIERSGSRRYAAFRIQGECMEPRFHDGEIVIVGESETVPDGVPGVFRLDGHCTLKVPVRHPDRLELRPLNPKFKSIDIRTNKLTVVGVVVGVWRKP
jgi:SOS-response transcriptional repressor LexA